MAFHSGCTCWANALGTSTPMWISCMQANVATSESSSGSKAYHMHMFAAIPSRMVPDHLVHWHCARDGSRGQ